MAGIAQYQLSVAGGGRQAATTAGTAIQLSTTSVPCSVVMLQAVSSNTACIVVCNSTAYASTGASRVGLPIWAGSTNPAVTVYTTDLQNVYIDGVSTDAVTFVYYRQTNP